jgi:hypothetical protein
VLIAHCQGQRAQRGKRGDEDAMLEKRKKILGHGLLQQSAAGASGGPQNRVTVFQCVAIIFTSDMLFCEEGVGISVLAVRGEGPVCRSLPSAGHAEGLSAEQVTRMTRKKIPRGVLHFYLAGRSQTS